MSELPVVADQRNGGMSRAIVEADGGPARDLRCVIVSHADQALHVGACIHHNAKPFHRQTVYLHAESALDTRS